MKKVSQITDHVLLKKIELVIDSLITFRIDFEENGQSSLREYDARKYYSRGLEGFVMVMIVQKRRNTNATTNDNKNDIKSINLWIYPLHFQ